MFGKDGSEKPPYDLWIVASIPCNVWRNMCHPSLCMGLARFSGANLMQETEPPWLERVISQHILSIPPYVPGKPVAELQRELRST